MRVVIKVGTNILTEGSGVLNVERIERFAAELAALKKAGHEIVLVSSGAIGAGMKKLGIAERPTELRAKQALAAVGQPLLMDVYGRFFGAHGITVAQVLLTRQDFDDRQRYLNARSTLLALLAMGVVPVINENDTVAVEEINLNIGDNDTLSALVAAKVCADLLVIFTDVDGLYRGVPGKSELIRVVEKITPEIEGCASCVSGSGKGVGGMKTKISAAKIATSAGVTVAVASGARAGVLQKLVAGEEEGTVFRANGSLEPRKCWIAFGTLSHGRIVIDEGAAVALREKGKSLLPSGIVGIEGNFEVGETVAIAVAGGKEIGRGLVAFSSDELARIKGKKTAEVRAIFPEADFEEAIHRDNLVIF